MSELTSGDRGRRVATLITSRVGSIVILLATLVVTALAFATVPDQPAAGPTDGLPAGKQSTRVTELADRFPSGRTTSAIVVYERAAGPLTAADRAAIAAASSTLATEALGGRLAPPVPSQDGRAELLVVPLDGSTSSEDASAVVDEIRRQVHPTGSAALPPGLTARVTGPAAFGRDIAAAFDGANFTLLAATAIVVAILLIVTYRSPVLWIVPLVVVGTGDQLTAQLLPWIARLIGERTDAQVAGIVTVLVFGAGTDYALLLIARYREELRRHEDRREAMAEALRNAGPAILASATTVILALLTLLAALLTGNRTLGIAAALGIAVALVFGLVVLPAALVCFGRWVFWPFAPTLGSADPTATGLWSRVAGTVGRRPGRVLVVSLLILGALSAGLGLTRVGVPQTDQFRTEVESVTAQETLARHFPAGASEPVVVLAATPTAPEVARVVRGTPGVAALIGWPERSDDGTLTRLTVELRDGSGTAGADAAIEALGSRLAAVDGADALVGGPPAADLDQRDANTRDDLLIVPLIVAVVLVVLVVLLRSLTAPLLLVLTVLATYAGALGAATLVLRSVFDMPALDAGVPLLGFLFLAALGVDYNIFLATRAREETTKLGSTGAGMLRALTVTGGVITSAGILLAAVFAVLGVLPVIALTQIGVLVGIGVILDTLLVRTLLVPALALLLGERFWWPAHPAGRSDRPGRHAAR